MKREVKLTHKFVEYIPDILDEHTIYVSMIFAIATHKCCCGCGNEVITPISPTDWQLTFDGETISLYPSIGNWNFKCKSHYWIKHNKVQWAPRWSQEKTDPNKASERFEKEIHFGNQISSDVREFIEKNEKIGEEKIDKSFLQKLKKLLLR